MEKNVSELTAAEQKVFNAIRRFTESVIRSKGLADKVGDFFFGVARKGNTPFYHGVFMGEDGRNITVANVLVIDSTPVCHTHVQVSLEGDGYVLFDEQ